MFGEKLRQHIKEDHDFHAEQASRQEKLLNRIWGLIVAVAGAAAAVMIQNATLHGETAQKTEQVAQSVDSKVAQEHAVRACRSAGLSVPLLGDISGIALEHSHRLGMLAICRRVVGIATDEQSLDILGGNHESH